MTSIEGLDLELVIDAYRLMDIDSDHLNTHTRTTIVIMVVLWHHHCERTLEHEPRSTHPSSCSS